MTDQVYPTKRRFLVHHALRRYGRVVYQCGGIYTVLEDPGLALTKYPKDFDFSVTLVAGSPGIYERDDDKSERFAHHELDGIVKDGSLKELPIDLPVGDCIAAATDLAANYEPSGIISPAGIEQLKRLDEY